MSLRLFPGLLGRISAAARCTPTPTPARTLQSARGFASRSGPRLDSKQFFTPLRRPAAPGASGAAGSGKVGWKGLGVGGLFKRAFGTTKPTQIIRTQWTQNQRRGGPRPTWWRKLQWRLNSIPPQYLVSMRAGREPSDHGRDREACRVRNVADSRPSPSSLSTSPSSSAGSTPLTLT